MTDKSQRVPDDGAVKPMVFSHATAERPAKTPATGPEPTRKPFSAQAGQQR
jgi:hypothetical protein